LPAVHRFGQPSALTIDAVREALFFAASQIRPSPRRAWRSGSRSARAATPADYDRVMEIER
jgi:hypothetical protein